MSAAGEGGGDGRILKLGGPFDAALAGNEGGCLSTEGGRAKRSLPVVAVQLANSPVTWRGIWLRQGEVSG